MIHYYVTWQPDVAEAGDYFLTHIESSSPNLGLGEIMALACQIEEIEAAASFDLCSILRIDSAATVIH